MLGTKDILQSCQSISKALDIEKQLTTTPAPVGIRRDFQNKDFFSSLCYWSLPNNSDFS